MSKSVKGLIVALVIALIASIGYGYHMTQKSSALEGAITQSSRSESYINGVIYQLSAEVAGLQYQAYELAKIRLEQRIAEQKSGVYKKPIAVISDIDDTLTSDAPFMAEILQSNPTWDNGPWDHYYEALATEACTPIPGALEFCKYAESKGVPVFYITNRPPNKEKLTIAQLQKWGFPYADKEHVQVMTDENKSDKTERRSNVEATHDVVMYIGDNIGDFTDAFKRELGPIKRTELASDQAYKSLWGDRWIVLPNATYGDYVGAAWFKKDVDAKGKAEYIKKLLDHYKFTNKDLYKTWYKGKAE